MTTEVSTSHRDVALILKDLLKVIKVVSLYPEDNPLPKSLRQSFSEKLADIAGDRGGLRIIVDKDTLIYEEQVVFRDRSREEALAGIFFENGITSFSFSSDIEAVQLFSLLEVFKRFHNTQDADLCVLLWEANIKGFSFEVVEDVRLSEYEAAAAARAAGEVTDEKGRTRGQYGYDGADAFSALFSNKTEIESGSLSDTPSGIFIDVKELSDSGSLFQGNSPDEGAPAIEQASIEVHDYARASGFDDLKPQQQEPRRTDTALILNDEFKLSEEEEYQIGHILADDADFDMFGSTMELLKELTYQESEMQSFYETVTICEKILHEFIVKGRLSNAGHMLGFLQQLENELRPSKGLWAERLKDARSTATSRERLKILLVSLNDHEEISAGELLRFLQNFGWEAISGLSDISGELRHPLHRQTLNDFLVHIGRDKVELLAKHLFDKRPEMVSNAVQILARIGGDRAFSYLKRVAHNEHASVRLILVNALAESTHPHTMDILKVCATDSEPDVRAAAVTSLIKMQSDAAFAAITDIINSQHFIKCNKDERQTLLNAYSKIGGELAVPHLSKLITAYNLTGDTDKSFDRKAAFEALSHNQSEKADRLLVSLSKTWRPEINKLALSAIRRRREILFGGVE